METLETLKTNSNIKVTKIIAYNNNDMNLENSWYEKTNIYKTQDINLPNFFLKNTHKYCKLSLIFNISELNTTVNIFKGSITFLTREPEETCKNISLELLKFLFADLKYVIIIFTHDIINKQFKLQNPKNIDFIIKNSGDFFCVQTFKSPCICFKQKITKQEIYNKKFNTYLCTIEKNLCVKKQIYGDVLKNEYNIKFKDKFVTFQVFNTKTVIATIFDYDICNRVYNNFLNLIENKEKI